VIIDESNDDYVVVGGGGGGGKFGGCRGGDGDMLIKVLYIYQISSCFFPSH
jgi:hypothetical protein